MALANRLNHSVTIERSSTTVQGDDVERDAYGNPELTPATLVSVMASIQPKSARELAQLGQGGPVVGSYTIFLLPTDLQEADRLLDTDAACSYAGRTFQLLGVRDPAGKGHHLECDAELVEPAA